jgi:NADPH:quinone reductase-like Zn-dependent oxidoreductase
MKAAVLDQLGSTPVFKEFPDPVIHNDEQLLITVKAASIKNLDKLRASGKHYASYTELPAIVGIDGVGMLEDGTRVYAQGITGMIATKALIPKNRYTPLPDHLDDITAAALPNAVIGATMALKYRGGMEKGKVVLVNGATGVTGQIAVQVAKHYGASLLIATGRNAASLEKLKGLGADIVISLKEDDADIIKQLKAIHATTPIDIVIDYLWGHPIELIIAAMKGGGLHTFTTKVRIVTVGGMAGEHINIASSTLRSSAIELLGSGLGSLSKAELDQFDTEILPEMFQLAADGHLKIETHVEPLENIEVAWNMDIAAGKRLVIAI